jgi:hypothetical protein
MSLRKLPVFLTVDTEIWPYYAGWPKRRLQSGERDLARQFDHCILGATTQGEFGVRYQLARLNDHGLRATYFVEPLHAAAVGEKWLAETVGMIVRAGQDVQMHAHTEWLSDARDPALPPQYQQFIRQFSFPDQVRILAWAKQRLESCGAAKIVAFRAGSFGANLDTLRALSTIGVPIDSSHNRCYLGGPCMIDTRPALYQRRSLDGIEEYPMTVFLDYPGHFRPAQLAACSSAEIERLLMQAWNRGWASFVMLWHGAELLQPDFNPNGPGQPSGIVVRRFERLCRFLAENDDKFVTLRFSDAVSGGAETDVPPAPLNSSPLLTAHRMVEQLVGRFL